MPRSVPQSALTVAKAEIEALQAEVKQLKRQLAEAHGGAPKAMTTAERVRRHRAKLKAKPSEVVEFEG